MTLQETWECGSYKEYIHKGGQQSLFNLWYNVRKTLEAIEWKELTLSDMASSDICSIDYVSKYVRNVEPVKQKLKDILNWKESF